MSKGSVEVLLSAWCNIVEINCRKDKYYSCFPFIVTTPLVRMRERRMAVSFPPVITQ